MNNNQTSFGMVNKMGPHDVRNTVKLKLQWLIWIRCAYDKQHQSLFFRLRSKKRKCVLIEFFLILLQVTFLLSGSVFKAHKSVLIAASKYFSHLFASTTDYIGLYLEIEIRDYDPAVFQKVLEYIYTGQIVIDNYELHELFLLLDAALFYELPQLQRSLEDTILSKYLNVQNATAIWRYGHEAGLLRLEDASRTFFV